jgi:hypothetical protein
VGVFTTCSYFRLLSFEPSSSSDAPLTNKQTACGFLQKMVGMGDYDLIGEAISSSGALRFRFSFVGVVQKCLVDRWGAVDNLACSNGFVGSYVPCM